MVWRHGKNTQFRVLSQGAKWAKWRWSVIFCCFLTLSICFFFFFFLRGQLSNLDKLDKIAKVNTGRGLVMFLSLAFFFPSVSLSDIILFSKSLTWIFCDGNSETKRLRQGYRRAGLCYVVRLHHHPQSQTKLCSSALENTYWTTETTM